MSIETKLQEFAAIAANPKAQYKKFKAEGQKGHRLYAVLRSGRISLCSRYGSDGTLGIQHKDDHTRKRVLRIFLLFSRPVRT